MLASQLHIKSQIKLLLLIAVFLMGGIIYQQVLPVLEGNDEPLHYAYLVWLRTYDRLPERAFKTPNPVSQESGQAPFTYWVAAQWADLLRLPVSDVNVLPSLTDVINPWFTPPNVWNRRDNFNMYQHGPDERLFQHPDVVQTNRAVRPIILVFALITVLGGYGFAKEFFPQRSWVLLATAVIAFMPQFLSMSAQLSNDMGAVAFSTLALWQTMRLLRCGATPARIAVIGGLAALAAFNKVSALMIVPGLLLAIVLDGRTRRLTPLRVIGHLGLLAAVMAVLLGPWIYWGWSTFGDPLGLRTHSSPDKGIQGVVAIASHILSELPAVYNSYWAKMASSLIYLSPVYYWLTLIVVALALIGYAAYLRQHQLNWRDLSTQRMLVCAVIVVTALLALIYWQATLISVAYAITARLVYFVHPILAVAIVGGLYWLSQHIPHRASLAIRASTLGLVMSSGLILGPLAIWATFQPPTLLAQNRLPPLHGTPIDYGDSGGTIRLLGAAYDTPFIQADTLYPLTLCWEVIQTTPRKAAFSVKLFDDAAQAAGERTSLHGLGHFSAALWNKGDVFCDRVEMAIKGPLKAGLAYNVVVTVWDYEELQLGQAWPATRDGKPLDSPLIARVASPAGNLADQLKVNWQPQQIQFGELADLRGAMLEGTAVPGGQVKLHLLWSVRSELQQDWSQFIHLTGNGQGVLLGGGEPRTGRYPTWAWTRGDSFPDTWTLTLPANLAPGQYELRVGFFKPASGDRLAAKKDGTAVPDNNPIVATFEIKP